MWKKTYKTKSIKITESKLRNKFRIEANLDPGVLVGQYVNLTSTGRPYKVLAVERPEEFPNGVARLQNWPKGLWFNGLHHYGYVQVSSIKYFSGDLINLFTERANKIKDYMKD